MYACSLLYLHSMGIYNKCLRSDLSAYWELTKPRIIFMVLVTFCLGFFVGGRGVHSFSLLFWSLVGTAFSVAGSAVLNNYLERDVDRLMHRTEGRPIPAGVIRPTAALSFGFILLFFGQSILIVVAGLLTAFLALLSAFLYVVIYTPMKRLSWINTSLGAVPGAMPPLGGWTAATGEIELGAWVFFLILFAWQHPHFFAIAWIFRDDYRRGGFKMLPVQDIEGNQTCRQIIYFSVLLLITSLFPTFLGLTGKVYLVGALILGSMLLASAVYLIQKRSDYGARKLLQATIFYLPLLFILCLIDYGF